MIHYTSIGNVTATISVVGDLQATDSIGNITAGIGDIIGDITSINGSIGAINAGRDILGNISAGGSIGDLFAANDIYGDISAGKNIGNIIAGGALSADLTTDTGAIGFIFTQGNITCEISAANGPLSILCLRSVTGSLYATATVYITAGGDVSGTINTDFGKIGVAAAGNVTGSISAVSDILIVSKKNIAVDAASYCGSVVENASGTITTNASASSYVSLIADTINLSHICVAGDVQTVGGGACFAAGTRVLLADGTGCPIESLTAGMSVLAVPEDDPTASPVAQRITEVFARPPARIFEVQILQHKLRTTARHRFYARYRGWVAASELVLGDLVRTPTGEYLAVTDLRETSNIEPVFNFSVEQDHTYYVMLEETSLAILVHNDYESVAPVQNPRGKYEDLVGYGYGLSVRAGLVYVKDGDEDVLIGVLVGTKNPKAGGLPAYTEQEIWTAQMSPRDLSKKPPRLTPTTMSKAQQDYETAMEQFPYMAYRIQRSGIGQKKVAEDVANAINSGQIDKANMLLDQGFVARSATCPPPSNTPVVFAYVPFVSAIDSLGKMKAEEDAGHFDHAGLPGLMAVVQLGGDFLTVAQPIMAMDKAFSSTLIVRETGSTLSGSAEILKILSGLKAGRTPGFKVVASEAELEALFSRLSAGGTVMTPASYKGTMVELLDGTKVGLRNFSSSGGKTIDVFFNTGTYIKVHIE